MRAGDGEPSFVQLSSRKRDVVSRADVTEQNLTRHTFVFRDESVPLEIRRADAADALMTQKLTLATLNAAPAGDFVATLANVFEHSPWVVEAAECARPFADLADLRAALIGEIDKAPPEQRRALIKAHPDLADRTQRAAGLTAASTAEQDGAGLDQLSDAEFALFEQSNAAYKRKFGFPFVLCVRRHTKDSILETFARRLQNPPRQEEREAITEIGRIATLRLTELVEGEPPLAVNGRLSTHILDTHAGQPAAGVELELIELSRHGADRLIGRAVTNSDGRTDRALIEDRPVPIGTYELRFHIGAYFASCGVGLSDPAFLDVVPVRFGASEPEGHLHVPLLVTPWSYTTYRGS
jgi:2-oxo-4-hydroxy-4-carboxy-5-ureidoimidazoline decarboxylase